MKRLADSTRLEDGLRYFAKRNETKRNEMVFWKWYFAKRYFAKWYFAKRYFVKWYFAKWPSHSFTLFHFMFQ